MDHLCDESMDFELSSCHNARLPEAEWHIYASLNWVIIGSGNDLLPLLRQATTWANDDLLSIRPRGTKISDFLNRNQDIFVDETAFENICQSGGHLVSASVY